jgi:hypothetical protein
MIGFLDGWIDIFNNPNCNPIGHASKYLAARVKQPFMDPIYAITPVFMTKISQVFFPRKHWLSLIKKMMGLALWSFHKMDIMPNSFPFLISIVAHAKNIYKT